MNKLNIRILCVSLIAVCFAMVAGATYAKFTAEETAQNVITTGYLAMDVIEKSADGAPWPEDGLTGIMPGMTVDKAACVVNQGGVPFYARAQVDIALTMASGETAMIDATLIKLETSAEGWIEKNGMYYYNRAIRPGEQTEPIVIKASFDPAMGNEYQGANLEIRVQAQSVQSDNNGGGDPLKARGWSLLPREIPNDATQED